MSTEIKTDREKAIEWWNALGNDGDRSLKCHKYFHGTRYFRSLTIREIESIWKQETQAPDLLNQ